MLRLLLAMMLGAAAACGAPQRGAYPAEYAANFKNACAASETPDGYCDCVWAKIEAEIPVNDFIGFDAATQNNQSHPVRARIERFMQQCLSPGRA
jgi:hypothetical protein